MSWRDRVYCGSITEDQIGQEVLLMGWVDAVRDHGQLLFSHIRDVSGMVQVVFDPRVDSKSYEHSTLLREEYVVRIRGRVEKRAQGTENPNLKTGSIEVFASELEILSESRMLPFQISEKAMIFGEELTSSPEHVDEDLRLRYRYLDLRRPSRQDLFIKRYEIIKCIREYLDQQGFIDMETPVLTKSTPEGARDYLVPSRVHQGRFYALPQSPQLFKQLIMMSGMDRYFQIVKCFRDEDLRPNRQPEFTQLDLEASFIDEKFIYDLIEEMTVRMFRFGGIELDRPFPRMTYEEAIERYGTDRPDLRFDMAFEDVTDIVEDTGYTVFRQIISHGGRVKGFCIRGQSDALSKNVLQNEYALKVVPSLGARGMTWMKVVGQGLDSNIVQFFSRTEQDHLIERFQARDGDVLMMIADTSIELITKVLCSLRLHVAGRLGLIPLDSFAPLWVTDFPLFEKKDEGLGSQHHPFTMPDRVDFDPSAAEELLQLKSRAYDLVMNGEELGGGSIRIHRMDIQEKIFKALGLGPEEIEAKFGFFLRALEYGCPPHGGLALGLDRVISMILQTSSIREVIAFPKNRSAFCPLTQAPSAVNLEQLIELGLSGDRLTSLAGEIKTRIQKQKPGQKEMPSAGKITLQQVRHVAKLARLEISDDETKRYQQDLNAILDHVGQLSELDTENVRPMSHVLRMKNVWREDKSGASIQTKDILENAPLKEKDYFKVPKILEG
jgi:aspartyl-tRNA synthetase